MADSLFVPNPYKPKFEMLNALTFADADSVDIFKNELQKVAIKYPTHEVGIRAQEILDYLRRGSVMDAVEKVAPTINYTCLLYTSPSPRDRTRSRMPSSA